MSSPALARGTRRASWSKPRRAAPVGVLLDASSALLDRVPIGRDNVQGIRHRDRGR